MPDKAILTASLLVLGLTASGIVGAADLFVYPGKGQSNEQMEKDKHSCYSWAKQTTGFDPMAAPTATSAPPQTQQPTASAGRGLIGGAAGGAIIGGIAGDAGKGAAIGAVTGGLFGGMRRQSQETERRQKEQQWAQREAGNYQARRTEYNRAYSACLEGRGYTVR